MEKLSESEQQPQLCTPPDDVILRAALEEVVQLTKIDTLFHSIRVNYASSALANRVRSFISVKLFKYRFINPISGIYHIGAILFAVVALVDFIIFSFSVTPVAILSYLALLFLIIRLLYRLHAASSTRNLQLAFRSDEQVRPDALSACIDDAYDDSCTDVYQIRGSSSYVTYSPNLNKFLQHEDSRLPYILHKGLSIDFRKSFSSPESRAKYAAFIDAIYNFRVKNHSQFLFNEQKIGLRSDVKKLSENPITLIKTDYFFSELTNGISCFLAPSNPDGSVISVPSILNKRGSENYLISLSNPGMSNHIGVSILAVTRDNYLVVWKQSNRAATSGNQLVPTGSGSVDYEDLVNEQGDLLEIVKDAMVRELFEESYQSKSVAAYFEKPWSIVDTVKIIGYFRWLDRGGLPQFAGLARLSIGVGEVSPLLAELFPLPPIQTAHMAGFGDGRYQKLEHILSMLYNIKEETISVPLRFIVDRMIELFDRNHYSDDASFEQALHEWNSIFRFSRG